MYITLETINSILNAAYPSNGFEHNNSNDAIVEKLNALNVTTQEIENYTKTTEFMEHARGYHALRGLYRYIKASRKASGTKSVTATAAASGKSGKASAPKAPKASAPKEPKKAEPKQAKAEPKQAEPPKMSAAEHQRFRACMNVLTVAGRPLLMTGPAGSGKSYMASMVAEACGATEFFTQSKVCYETDLKGFVDAHSNYYPTALYRAIKRADGGEKTAYFLDEIFAGDTSCLTVINDLLSDGRMTFPNGETLSAKNLVIMAADNTSGNGATNSYNTRNKADKSFLNRFGCVHVDYDKDIEKKLAAGHTDILEFVRAIRAAAEHVDIDIVCSYRTIDAMAKYADAGIDAAEAVNTFVYQDALTEDDKDTLRQDAKIERLIAKGNIYAMAM